MIASQSEGMGPYTARTGALTKQCRDCKHCVEKTVLETDSHGITNRTSRWTCCYKRSEIRPYEYRACSHHEVVRL